MPPLPSVIPSLPWETLKIIITIVAWLGAVLITYGVFLKTEKRQDVILAIGSLALLGYAIFIGNILFTIAMLGLFLASLIEFIEIAIGVHKDMGVLGINKKNIASGAMDVNASKNENKQ